MCLVLSRSARMVIGEDGAMVFGVYEVSFARRVVRRLVDAVHLNGKASQNDSIASR